MNYRKEKIESIKKQYPAGTKIELSSFCNHEEGMPHGLIGEVTMVDDAGQIHMRWSNGRSLALIPGEDVFRKLPQYTAEQKVYHDLLKKAPLLKAAGLNEDFKLLCEYDNVVLAGRENKKSGIFQFITWGRCSDGSVENGHYYEELEPAKIDFIKRSEFINSNLMFDREQIAMIYRSLFEMIERECELTEVEQSIIEKVRLQIENAYPEFENEIAGKIQETQQSM